MSNFKVGDKVYFESTILVAEDNDTYLVADRNGSRRFVAEDLTKTDESYNKGLNDTWELVRKIVLLVSEGGYSWQELVCIFGEGDCGAVLKAFTPQEALARAKAYEDERNEIRVGDVVKLKGTSHEAIVTRVSVTSLCFLFKDGSCASLSAKEDFEKTDKHFDSIDEFMKS